jgi:hypothetical protein
MSQRFFRGALFLVLCAATTSCGGDPAGPEPVGQSRAALTGGSWHPTSALLSALGGQQATPLPDGRVLVSGSGQGPPTSQSAEIYDPAAGAWHEAASLIEGRGGHTATLFQTPAGPRVLVAGGQGGVSNDDLASAEVYDPATDTWTAAAPMSAPRRDHTATLLADGRILVAGGGPIDAAVYDPAAGTWTLTGPMTFPRAGHIAALLDSGRVLVAGSGMPGAPVPMSWTSAEEYDPAAYPWTAVGSMTEARGMASAARLPGGAILVAGGMTETPPFTSQTAEIYDPAQKAFGAPIPMMASRLGQGAVPLSDGSVLLAGGSRVNFGPLPDAERFDPTALAFVSTSPLSTPRAALSLSPLPDGSALAAGGSDGNAYVATAELYRVDGSAGPSSSGGASSGGTATGGTATGGTATGGTASEGTSTGNPSGPVVIHDGCAHRAPVQGGLSPVLAALALGAAALRRRI